MRDPFDLKHHLTRTLAIGALVLLVLVAGALVYAGRSVGLAQLERQATAGNAALAQSFANVLWPHYRGFQDQSRGLSAEELRGDPRAAALDRAVRGMMAGTPVLEVALYDREGRAFFSTAPGRIGGAFGDSDRFGEALARRSAGELAFQESAEGLDGPRQDLWVQSSLLPLGAAGRTGEAEAVVEIRSDISDLRVLGARQQGYLAIGGALGFLLVGGLLLALALWADRQVRRYNDLNLALAASYAQVQAASRAKSVFLAKISHELRTPLNAIIGFAELVKDAAYGPLAIGKYTEFGRDIHASGLHLLAVIDDVLDLVNADNGDLSVSQNSVDTTALVRGVMEQTAERAKRAGVRLETDIGAVPATIKSDESKLRQILLNLTANAIDYTPSGGSVTLSLQERAKAGELVLEVSDTGLGIKREDIPKALAPFGQIEETPARKREGTGLGLPLAKKLAELLGGSLHIDSRHGIGTRVSVVLPSRQLERRRAIVRPAA